MKSDCIYSGNIQYVPLATTGFFSKLVIDYIQESETLQSFYKYQPNIDGIGSAIKDRENSQIDRTTLVAAIKEQYKSLELSEKVKANIDLLLSDTTFSITTAHQPNLATGYAYFIYKIMHAVVLAETAKQAYPSYNFVPVYYMGSEDDDLDELGFFRYNEHNFRWTTPQSGAVGAMSTKDLKPLLQDFFKIFGPPNEHTLHLQSLLADAYLGHATIAEATQFLVHELFKEYGVVVVNPDDASLKRLFLPIAQEELFRPVAHQFVDAQNKLLGAHYKTQAFARPINFFYLVKGLRKRIEQLNDNEWYVVDTVIKWNKQELEQELATFPERFSPNVILRGLFQETILPNVAFIGGGAEVAYWFQLKQVFDQYKVFFPVLVLRQSAQFLTLTQQQQMDRLGWDMESIFTPTDTIINQLVAEKGNQELTLTKEWEAIAAILQLIQEKAKAIDHNLDYSAAAAKHKMEHQIQVLTHKMYKAEKRKFTIEEQRIRALKDSIFPKGALQERYYTFMQEYAYLGPSYLELLHSAIKPFGNEFLIVT